MGLLDGTTQNQYYDSSNSANYGNYQFTTLENIINAFMIMYVGEGKIINKVNRTDVQFHAMRAIQELSYDVLRSFKSQEIEVPNTLSMVLPQDYVNYVKIVRVGTDGLERHLYPARKTSDPFAITQNADGTYDFGLQNRKITINIADEFEDGEYIRLKSPYNSHHYFVANTLGNTNMLSDTLEETLTTGISEGATVQTVTVLSGAGNTVHAGFFYNAINALPYYSVTIAGSLLTIEYLEDQFPVDSNNTANFVEIVANDSNVVQGDFTVTILNAGTEAGDNLTEQTPSNTSENFQNVTPVDYQLYDVNYSSDIEISTEGRRYGLDPQYSQINGSFFIDQLRGLIKFGAALAGETVTLHYVSDGLGTDSEMVVHKFCEEACYKHIAYGVLSTRSNIPEYLVQRYKKERFAETRKAKIRLSNIKIEEFTQVLKGMGKQIK